MKRLVIEVCTKRGTKERYLRIIQQTHTGDYFGTNTSTFKATNGFILRSQGLTPTALFHGKRSVGLNVRYSSESINALRKVKVPSNRFLLRLREAVDEYNKSFKEDNKAQYRSLS